jgi:hypothetical protein
MPPQKVFKFRKLITRYIIIMTLLKNVAEDRKKWEYTLESNNRIVSKSQKKTFCAKK